ncbi:MAG: hypothetical protein ABI369_09745 [Acetobacteraceae bacterium]
MAILIAALLSISPTAVAASTTGATLHASGETVIVNKKNETRIAPSQIENGGSEDFVGNGFGPGEVVSIFLTFPDGRVFPVDSTVGDECCQQAEEALADGTGSFSFTILFDQFPTTTGSLTDGTRYTNRIFALPPEFAAGAIPYGVYTVTAIGRVSLQKATVTITIIPPSGPDVLDGSVTSTSTLLVFTTIGHQVAARQVDPVITNAGQDNPNVDVACNGLIPNEAVSFWDTYPDGSVVALSTISADSGGSAVIQVELLTGKFPVGLHTFSCRGNTSNYVTSGAFLLLPGGIGSQTSIGNLVCSYAGAPQAVANSALPQLPSFFASDFLVCTARNFRPNETVSFWQTFPDQTAHFLATVRADASGVSVVVIQLFPGPLAFQNGKAVVGDAALFQVAFPAGVDGRIPVGRHAISARGDSSGFTASTTFDLTASQVDP